MHFRMQIKKEEKDFIIQLGKDLEDLKDREKLVDTLKHWKENHQDIVESHSKFFILDKNHKEEVLLN